MEKDTLNEHPVNDLIKSRWSTRAFSDKPVDKEKIRSLIEAARWAPSAFNEQPWRFIVGIKGDKTYDLIMESLVEWNQKWAKTAPVLILNIAKKTFSHNGTQNVTFKYDLGQAVAFMILEAIDQGLASHQMSGFDTEKAVKFFNISDDFQPVSVTAFGYQEGKDVLEEDYQKMEENPRIRKPKEELLFSSGLYD
jgi:nitroreductase